MKEIFFGIWLIIGFVTYFKTNDFRQVIAWPVTDVIKQIHAQENNRAALGE